DLLLPLVEPVFGVIDPFAERRETALLDRGLVGGLARRIVTGRVRRCFIFAFAGQNALHPALPLGKPPPAALADVAHRAKREEAALLLFLLEDDLRQCDRREVLFGLVVDDLDVVAIANHLADLVERYISAVLGVVQLAVRISLDDPGLGHRAPTGRAKDGSMIPKSITQRAMSSTCHTIRVGIDFLARLRAVRDPRMRMLALIEAFCESDPTTWVHTIAGIMTRAHVHDDPDA